MNLFARTSAWKQGEKEEDGKEREPRQRHFAGVRVNEKEGGGREKESEMQELNWEGKRKRESISRAMRRANNWNDFYHESR